MTPLCRNADVMSNKSTNRHGREGSPGVRQRLQTDEGLSRRATVNDAATTQRLATVVRDSNDAVLLLDLNGNIRAWNRGAQEMYGYTEKEALAMRVRDLVPVDKRAETDEFMRRLAAGEVAKSFETTRLTKDGRLCEVWLTVTVLSDDKGAPVSIATTERDITERKRAEQERRRSTLR